MTLRTRFTVAAAVALALAVTAALVAVYVPLRSALRHEIDASLRQRADAVAREIAHDRGRERDEGGFELETTELGVNPGYVQLITADGAVMRPRGESVALPVTATDEAVATGHRGPLLRDADTANVHIRLITVPVNGGGAVQVARPLTEVDRELASIRLVFLVVVGVGAAVAAASGWLVARTALVPVAEVTRAAEEIAATHDLGRRLGRAGSDELARLARRFDEMLAALEDAQERQRQLIGDASHELRTPLTSLRTNIELLARADRLPPEDQRRLITDVRTQVEELSDLVADVVDLARGEEPPATASEVRLDELIATAVERARRHRPGVAFTTDLEPTIVTGVPERLDRAIANILDNAAKWSPAGGRVEVVLTDGECAVRDEGPGIAAADIPHVFDRFYRSATARDMPGSGLGLAIVRQIIDAHDGTIAVESPGSGGTVVRFRLPRTSGVPSDGVLS